MSIFNNIKTDMYDAMKAREKVKSTCFKDCSFKNKRQTD